jgi:hypothetical protein
MFRHARLTVAFALVLSACSADKDGGEGAATPTTDSTTRPVASIHDLAGPAPEGAGANTPDQRTATSSSTDIASGPRQRSAPTTTVEGSQSATTTTTLPPGLPPEKCPDADSCRRYHITSPPARWPIVNGRAAISYLINPVACGPSSGDMRRAMEDAASSWQRAAPTLNFTFAGFTDRLPVPGDGHNVIACTGGAVANPAARDGTIIEADMFLGSGGTYSPCEQADDSCTPLPGDGTLDIASLATHEFGHWLWLGDMTDHPVDRELTMSPGDNQSMGTRSRHWRTLALGDVLGVRTLYPCSCPLPTIYTP